MQYANTIKEVPNACKEGPLVGEELNTYFVDTMETRTGDKYTSPIDEIAEACELPSERNSFLLLGHRGCGKSTELNRLAVQLEAQGIPVHSVCCNEEINLATIEYSDLMILMGDALLSIASEHQIPVAENLAEAIRDFWTVTEDKTFETMRNVDDERTVGFSGQLGLQSILSLFASMKGSIRYSDARRTTYRQKVSHHASEWISMLRVLIDQITDAIHHQPVLIFEDLDKLTEESAWRVFLDFSGLLSALSCPVVYTFPIALSYSQDFAKLESYFDLKFLPMIKIENLDGTPNSEGKAQIREIIEKRMNTGLFVEDSLDYMIEKTGGALRDLFKSIIVAARRANRRGSDVIDQKDAEIALARVQSDLTRRIEAKHYVFLASIYKGNRKDIQDREMLLKMLVAGTVLEYNGQRWNNVHPLVTDFLVDQGFISREQ